MKKVIVIIIVVFLTSINVYGQDSVRIKPITFKAKITDPVSKAGYLSAFSDSSLFISSQAVSFNSNSPMNGIDTCIYYQNLSQVHLRRKGSTGRGLAIGAGSGALSGIILGLISGDDYKKNQDSFWCLFCMTTSEKVAAYGIGLGAIGGITGAIIGATARKKFIINGRQDKFNNFRNHVLQRVTVKK